MSESLRRKSSGIEESVRTAVGKKPMRWGLESPDELIGTRIDDRFTVVECIARGGMGAVFKAIQAPMGRVCAVKVLSASYEGKKDPAFDKRFRREAATISRLRHPATVTLYDFGNIGDLYYMAMEYVDGRTLHAEVFHEGRLEERRARRIAMQICRSLREAHEHGVIHRDLKPDNILLVDRADERDLIKVFDFGLAKVLDGDLAEEDVTETGLCMGSPKHMAPEQILGDTVSAHTDIYALGILMYEMLTAHSPFDRPTRYQTLMAQVHEAPMPFQELLPEAEISPAMEAVVMRCLEKERPRRYTSMNDVLQAIKAVDRGSRSSMPSITSTSTSVPQFVDGSGFGAGFLDPRASQPSRHSLFPPASGSSIPPPGIGEPLPTTLPELPDLPPLPNLRVGDKRAVRRPILAGLTVLALGMAAATVAWFFATTSSVDAYATAGLPGLSSSLPALAPPPVQDVAGEDDGVRVVHVISVPPGARVYEDDRKLCEKTPCEVKWRGKDRDGEHELRLERLGFMTAQERVSTKAERLEVSLIPAGPRPESPPEGPREVLAEDTGYKYSPY